MNVSSKNITKKPKLFVPKKILLMGHTDGHGGSQTAFRKLCNFAEDEGHIVKTITISNSNNYTHASERSEFLGNIVHTGNKYSLKAKKLLGVIRLGLKASSYRPDIFVCVGLNNSSNSIARFLPKSCFKLGQDFIANRSADDYIWQSSKKAMDGLVVQAPSMLAYWKKLDSQTSNINWLPCFPETPVEGVLKNNDRNIQIIKLAYFGRLAGNKGLDLLLSALAELDRSHGITLDIWGKGDEETSLKALAVKLGIDNVVRFWGSYPSGEHGAKLIASYHSLVLCSTEMEGLPLILLESMAYGVPFLATNVGAIADCCINNPDAILADPTPESILEGLKNLVYKIQTGYFKPNRLRAFYDKTFSHSVMSSRWRKFFENPKQFFI